MGCAGVRPFRHPPRVRLSLSVVSQFGPMRFDKLSANGVPGDRRNQTPLVLSLSKDIQPHGPMALI